MEESRAVDSDNGREDNTHYSSSLCDVQNVPQP